MFQQQLRGITIKLEAKHINLFLKTFKKFQNVLNVLTSKSTPHTITLQLNQIVMYYDYFLSQFIGIRNKYRR